jgi:hypothetical protein
MPVNRSEWFGLLTEIVSKESPSYLFYLFVSAEFAYIYD